MSGARASRAWPAWVLAGVMAGTLLAACAGGSSSPALPATPPAATPATTPAATPAGGATIVDVKYESTNNAFEPGTLDVYAPAGSGTWPVVVMLHGGVAGSGVTKSYLSEHARRVADEGFVVFVPSWGQPAWGQPEGSRGTSLGTAEIAAAVDAQAACAVEFARAHAAEYGGDPRTLVLFGHSGGANVGAQVAFARPAPSSGCLGPKTLGRIDTLIAWEGDWILADPGADPFVAANPSPWDAMAPWGHLAAQKAMRVALLVSDNPGLTRTFPDQAAVQAFLAARPVPADVRQRIEARGDLADLAYDVTAEQELLFDVLKAQGNPVTLDVMPDSTHESLGPEGWKVFLAAFRNAIAR